LQKNKKETKKPKEKRKNCSFYKIKKTTVSKFAIDINQSARIFASNKYR